MRALVTRHNEALLLASQRVNARGFGIGAVLLLLTPLAPAISTSAQWNVGNSGTTASLRGIHNAGGGVVWASGASGVVLRSEDEGYLWQQCTIPPGGGKLDFRGIWAWNANHAIAMSSGPGDTSRLYETMDGCAHWHLLFTNPDSGGFWDAIAFWNESHGMLLGDPVDGHFTIFTTTDAGRHWSRDHSAKLEASSREQGAFAASNSALALGADGESAYFGTGGIGGSRIFRLQAGSAHRPSHWISSQVTLSRPTESAGIFSIAFHDARHGVVVGGDYKQPNQNENSAAWTSDGGFTWTIAARPPTGFRSAVAWDQKLQAWIAVGPNGSDLSRDGGKTWRQFDRSDWNGLSLPWAVGPDGRIAILNESLLKSLAP